MRACSPWTWSGPYPLFVHRGIITHPICFDFAEWHTKILQQHQEWEMKSLSSAPFFQSRVNANPEIVTNLMHYFLGPNRSLCWGINHYCRFLSINQTKQWGNCIISDFKRLLKKKKTTQGEWNEAKRRSFFNKLEILDWAKWSYEQKYLGYQCNRTKHMNNISTAYKMVIRSPSAVTHHNKQLFSFININQGKDIETSHFFILFLFFYW